MVTFTEEILSGKLHFYAVRHALNMKMEVLLLDHSEQHCEPKKKTFSQDFEAVVTEEKKRNSRSKMLNT